MRPPAAGTPLLAVALLLVPSGLSAGPPVLTPEQKVLDRFTGTWKSSFTAPKAEWTPVEKTGTATVTAERVLGGSFVQEKHANGDGTSGLVLRSYDPERKAYRVWWFSSTGQALESVGTWDEKAATLTSKADATGFSTTTVNRFADPDTLVWEVSVKGADGRALFRMEGKSVRVKKDAK